MFATRMQSGALFDDQRVEEIVLDPHGGLWHASGKVRRSGVGELLIQSFADGAIRLTTVPRVVEQT
jgi:hypothetical protein